MDKVIIKQLFCMLLIIFCYSKIYSQSLPTIIPPSPSSTALEQFGSYPVDLSTGLTQVEVPIYTIEQGKLKCPISLSYHGSGTKVSDESYPVGLGWVLSAGGRISRNILGRPDEYYFPSEIQDNGDVDYLNSFTVPDLGNQYYGMNDGEYDVFSYSLGNGEAGKFILDCSNKPNYTGFSVPFNNNIIKGYMVSNELYFEITDIEGNFYRFGKNLNNTRYVETTGINGGDITTWMLTDIISPDKVDTIHFKYSKAMVSNQDKQIFSYNDFFTHNDYNVRYGLYSTNTPPSLFTTTYQSYINNIGFKILALTEITFRGGKVSFNYDSENIYLQNVQIFDDENNLIKNTVLNRADFPNQDVRKKLVKVSSFNGSVESDKYEFEYNENGLIAPGYSGPYNGGSSPFLSKSIDFWGYYNGKPNSSLIPNFQYPMRHYNYNYSITGNADRTSDETSMKLYTLTKINYPTGGYTKFYYETNKYFDQLASQYANYTVSGGGLRIKRIVNYNTSADSIIRRFEYGNSSYPGAGIASWIPRAGNFINQIMLLYLTEEDLGYYYSSDTFRQNTISGTSNHFNPFFTAPVFYEKVTEYIDENSILGKNVYTYELPEEKPQSAFQNIIYDDGSSNYEATNYIYEQPYYSTGDLATKEIYKYQNGDYFLQKKIENTYQGFLYDNKLKGLKVYKSASFLNDCTGCGPLQSKVAQSLVSGALTSNVIVGEYFINQGVKKLTLTKETDFSSSPVEKISRYRYDNQTNLLPTLYSFKTSPQDSILTTYKYPFDFSSSQPYTDMVSKNMISPVIEESTFKNSLSTSLSSSRNNYTDWGASIIKPGWVDTKIGSASYETRVRYYSYDSYGNPTCVSKEGGTKTCYVYSYNGKYPIAEISNADYATVVSALSGSAAVNDFAAEPNPSEDDINTFLGLLRNSPSLQNSLVTTYTYKPLVGMTSSTDPKGMTTYYEYDAFGRLKSTKDAEGNVIQSYDYHYSTQN